MKERSRTEQDEDKKISRLVKDMDDFLSTVPRLLGDDISRLNTDISTKYSKHFFRKKIFRPSIQNFKISHFWFCVNMLSSIFFTSLFQQKPIQRNDEENERSQGWTGAGKQLMLLKEILNFSVYNTNYKTVTKGITVRQNTC